MSLRGLPSTLRDLRGVAVVALLCAAVAAYSRTSYRYHEFFAGAVVGLLLVLVVQLFRAHPAEVERAPPDPPAPQE